MLDDLLALSNSISEPIKNSLPPSIQPYSILIIFASLSSFFVLLTSILPSIIQFLKQEISDSKERGKITKWFLHLDNVQKILGLDKERKDESNLLKSQQIIISVSLILSTLVIYLISWWLNAFIIIFFVNAIILFLLGIFGIVLTFSQIFFDNSKIVNAYYKYLRPVIFYFSLEGILASIALYPNILNKNLYFLTLLAIYFLIPIFIDLFSFRSFSKGLFEKKIKNLMMKNIERLPQISITYDNGNIIHGKIYNIFNKDFIVLKNRYKETFAYWKNIQFIESTNNLPILENLKLVKLCDKGFEILYQLAKYVTVTKEEDLINPRLSPISLVYSNSLIFLGSAFNDALEGRYPSSANNLRASFEAHLLLEKLYRATDEELKIYKEHRDPTNEKTFNAYWDVFRPGKIMDLLPADIKEKFKLAYKRMSSYAHSSVFGIIDNVQKEMLGEQKIVAFGPSYQRELTESRLKDILAMIWLNSSSISRIFSDRLSNDIKQKINLWGDKLENIGAFSNSTNA